MRINSRVICFAFPPSSSSYFLRSAESPHVVPARDILYIMQIPEKNKENEKKRTDLPRHLFLTVFIMGALEIANGGSFALK